jgi:predicted nucleic acid-binding protein
LIFIDTTVWVGAADKNDDLHDSATKIIDALTSGSLPLALTTDFIIDESVTILGRRKAFGAEQAMNVGKRILSSPRVFTVFIDEALLNECLERYPKHKGRLSLTDVCSLTVMEKYGIKEIYSHDSDFDLAGLRRKERVS